MAKEAAAAAASSSSPPPCFTNSWKYHVFLSFRGEDTRYNFTGHLCTALRQKGINTFMDDYLSRGEEISTALIKAIEESRISIIVFSESYASSRWCLDELVKILDCKKSNHQMVVPVFYRVSPSDVRNQKGCFGDGLAYLECKYKDNIDKIYKWRAALSEAANLSGWTLLDKQEDESKVIHNIVEGISAQVINRTYLDVAEYPVGIEYRAQEVNDLLHVGINDVRMVGLWGTGGIGKSTIAKAVYNNLISHNFEGSCFLSKVRESSMTDKGLAKLQKTLLYEILGEDKLKVANVDKGITLIKERLSSKRILLVLDDVNDKRQLRCLAGGSDGWFGIGSRIIITTRDNKLLTAHHRNISIYEVKKLNYRESLELFCWNAFESKGPLDGYAELADHAIGCAQGLPLVLRVLGSHLYGESMDKWQAIIDGQIKSREIPDVFKISYDALDEIVKVLDIACFFKGRQSNHLIEILEGCELNPKHGIVAKVKMDVPSSSGQGSVDEMKAIVEDNCNQRHEGEPVSYKKIKLGNETYPAKQENATHTVENAAGTKSGKPKIKGVSMTELFTPEQVRAHITGLRQWVGQSKAKAEKNQAMEHSMSEISCQLCAVEKLTFEPPPIYCTPCGVRIKRNAMCYTMGAGDTGLYFCIPCYNEARGDMIVSDGANIPKARLQKKKNDEETEEWWVQCDKCEAWQHQICALFNWRRNDGGQAEYTCPNCYIQEVERGERKPLPQNAVLGAKDLPWTILSDHIERRLFKKLKVERQERARQQGKSYDEVPGAESLVIRVVSSVDKKLEVKQRFLEIFQEENYPTEFPYKSKVLLLFQKIEGVEVCLFGMYVQEFGAESEFPNQRRVYLSCLDSVKYFRPEVKAVTGEALRTYVYHEILIGYLEYCKLRGFTSCYIWACPPLKVEDYILYCPPEIQKTPKSDKLREWYLAMLRKAAKEGIVVELTNLYDHFFVTTAECKAKVTAARLPYFDGDYWPGAAEDLINQMRQEEDGRKQNKRKRNKKGSTKKTITERALKASGQTDLPANASKDLLLMHKLGETISPMKEDFIMVHLQYACSHCCILMVSGNRWSCTQCRNFQLCDKCYEAEQKREERDRHPINQREKHELHPFQITDVPMVTKDRDEILESEFFDTRQAFLSLCQGNHYQYDTLRRAKHSSIMVLYHLHNPTAPAFVTTCNRCHLEIETGQGWHCEVCPEYDVCNNCYQKEGGVDHHHKLTNHPSIADCDAQNKEARQMRVVQLRKMLDLLVHASQCRSAQCRSAQFQYPNCRKVQGLFRHGIQCKVRASGGCVLCKKMWYLLQLHARACKISKCPVPRCRDLKEHLRKLQQQSDSRRRAAVMEMMRQRAAELHNSSV